MLKVGNKFKIVKSIGVFDFKNEVFTVCNITEDCISFTSELGIGCISTDDFDKHCERVKVWTPWISMGILSYKTDNEKYVKIKAGGYTTKASCHPCDEFDLETGIRICVEKMITKLIS